MKCLTCGGPMTTRRANHHYKESGLPNIVLINIDVRSCQKCGAREVVIPRMDELHRVIARTIITKEPKLQAHHIKFLRKCLGWSGTDFASYMAVQPETVSRWEAGTQEMGAVSDRLLRLLVSNQEPAIQYPIGLFKEKHSRTAKATLKFKADPTWRAEAA